MLQQLLLSPPVAFAVLFAVIVAFSSLSKRMAFQRKGEGTAAAGSEYACGEDFKGYMAQPDYSQFFPFAFFFTILHIIALIATTVPVDALDSLTIPVFYLVGAVIALSVFLRGVRNK
jgi:NADH:ubiquinone oxidoreductase subunit 3 (subunit A)